MYNKFDYFRNSIFHSAKGQFHMMLQEGHSLQDVQSMAAELQMVITRALQMAGAEAIVQLGPHPTPPEPPEPEKNPFL